MRIGSCWSYLRGNIQGIFGKSELFRRDNSWGGSIKRQLSFPFLDKTNPEVGCRPDRDDRDEEATQPNMVSDWSIDLVSDSHVVWALPSRRYRHG